MTPDNDVLVLAEMRERFPIATWSLPANRRGLVEGLISPATFPHARQAQAVVEQLGRSSDQWRYDDHGVDADTYSKDWWCADAMGQWKGVRVELRAVLPKTHLLRLLAAPAAQLAAEPVTPTPAPIAPPAAETALAEQPADETEPKRRRRKRKGNVDEPVATAHDEDGPTTQTMGAIA